MQKDAQQRGWFNKIREKSNITGKILESINPEFAQVMDRLRKTDEKVRDIATDMKDLPKIATKLVNRRDYLSAATKFSTFHEKCRIIAAHLKKFEESINLKHYQFILDQFDDEQKKELFGYDPNKELSLSDSGDVNDISITAALKKDAGLAGWLGFGADNPDDARALAMKALERRFNITFLKNLKVSTNTMSARTEEFSSFLLAVFKRLATALATRHIDQYIAFSKEFIKRFARYHELFVKYYTDNIVPLKEQYQKIQAEKQAIIDKKQEEIQKQRELDNQGRAAPFPPPYQPSLKPETSSVSTPITNAPVSKQEQENALEKLRQQQGHEDDMPISLTQRKSSIEFINRLEALASENNQIAVLEEMLAYSATLEDESPEESIKILAIAEGLAEQIQKDADKKDEHKKPNILEKYLNEKPKSLPKTKPENDSKLQGVSPPLA
jgi:hypothetical protein